MSGFAPRGAAGPAGPAGPVGPVGPARLEWSAIAAQAATRYLWPGGAGASAATNALVSRVVEQAGILANWRSTNQIPLGASVVTYTVVLNGAPTAITWVQSSAAVGIVLTATPLAVVVGDRVAIATIADVAPSTHVPCVTVEQS